MAPKAQKQYKPRKKHEYSELLAKLRKRHSGGACAGLDPVA